VQATGARYSSLSSVFSGSSLTSAASTDQHISLALSDHVAYYPIRRFLFSRVVD
jgi:hypothetical protein